MLVPISAPPFEPLFPFVLLMSTLHALCVVIDCDLWKKKKKTQKLKNGKQFDQIYIAQENRLIDKIN